MVAWFAGASILLLGSVGSGPADQLIELLFIAIYSIVVTFVVGFRLALCASRLVAKYDYRPSPILGALVGSLTAVGVLIVVALPFYGFESVSIVFRFFFSPIVGSFAVIGGVTGLLVALEMRGTTSRRSQARSRPESIDFPDLNP
ncbi:MAG: hypothetical protein P1U68_18260 [Verrucomicrobiales bacterium]|nr:hypothetical protein [Verrucomicrobiales bacterium]